MTVPVGQPVVVGVDGGPAALRAVRVAARHAAARGVELQVVHVGDSVMTGGLPRQAQLDPAILTLLADAETAARIEVPRLRIHRRSIHGGADEVLLALSHQATLLVIGHRGPGARIGPLVGSLGSRLAGCTACPLLVVHHIGDASGPVVVGVDDPAASDDLFRAAFGQARILSRSLRVVHAWHVPAVAVAGSAVGHGHHATDLARVDALAAEAARIGREYPDVAVTTESHHGREQAVLFAAAEGASLLIVGAHGPGGLRRMLHGSPGMSAAQHVACPVLIVGTAAGDR